ncbi:Cytochrome P450 1A4 [Hypsibius exemplaris]|uniref:Cytochrome P450 1A4 n=1 Tax=Hypsibius exemplaris TaxID=2072580 RepID=A0A1W0X4I4_HYPEX|nr:Cytochrome P450 1A4 [Hypsibius exemplaris]
MHRAAVEFFTELSGMVDRSVFLVLTLAMSCAWIGQRRYGPRRLTLPPSPFQFPLLGCLPFLNSKLPHETFTKWAVKFGKIYSCRMGQKLIVVLNDCDLIREALSKSVFNGRPHMYTAQETSKGLGISFASDDTWPIHRRFALKTFIALGAVKGKVEEQIQDEAQKLVNRISDLKGQSFSNKNLLQTAVGNVICNVLFGQRSNEGESNNENPDMEVSAEFYDKMNAVFRFFGAAGIINIFPFLRWIPAIGKSYEKVKDALEGAAKIIERVIVNHENCLDSSAVRDYTDAFIQKKNEEKLLYGSPKHFTDQQFVGAARELFLTGYDTTTSTLRWAFLYVAKHPEIQAKVQAELDNVVGRARLPAYSDLKKMPYTQAAIFESQRLSSIAPLGLPHRAVDDTELCGYHIPKDTWIFTNIWHAHHDANIWEEPHLSAQNGFSQPMERIS